MSLDAGWDGSWCGSGEHAELGAITVQGEQAGVKGKDDVSCTCRHQEKRVDRDCFRVSDCLLHSRTTSCTTPNASSATGQTKHQSRTKPPLALPITQIWGACYCLGPPWTRGCAPHASVVSIVMALIAGPPSRRHSTRASLRKSRHNGPRRSPVRPPSLLPTLPA